MQLAVGRIGRPHGTGGEVHIDVRTDDPGQRLAAGEVLATDPPDRGPLTVVGTRWHSGGLLARFAEVADRTAAEWLRGTWLVIDSADLPPTQDPDEFHDSQLIGLTVRTTDGHEVGTVADVLHYGQDLLVVRGRGPGEASGGGGTGDSAAAAGAGRAGGAGLPGVAGRAGGAGGAGGAGQAGGVAGAAGAGGAGGAGAGAGLAGAAGEAIGSGGAGEVLVPFVAAIVPEVDVRAGHLIIDPPPGLLDPGEAL